MGVSHTLGNVSAVFDDPNLVSCAGLAPVVAMAQRCGLTDLVAERLTLPVKGGCDREEVTPPTSPPEGDHRVSTFDR